jgi:hypothetical protein
MFVLLQAVPHTMRVSMSHTLLARGLIFGLLSSIGRPTTAIAAEEATTVPGTMGVIATGYSKSKAGELGLPGAVRVVDVFAGCPGDGVFQKKDLIAQLNDTITVDVRAFADFVRSPPAAGETVHVVYYRNGQRMETDLVLAPRKPNGDCKKKQQSERSRQQVATRRFKDSRTFTVAFLSVSGAAAGLASAGAAMGGLTYTDPDYLSNSETMTFWGTSFMNGSAVVIGGTSAFFQHSALKQLGHADGTPVLGMSGAVLGIAGWVSTIAVKGNFAPGYALGLGGLGLGIGQWVVNESRWRSAQSKSPSGTARYQRKRLKPIGLVPNAHADGGSVHMVGLW